MKELDDLTRARFRRELSWGDSKPTPERYQRTTGLQQFIMDQYGRRGAEFIMAQQGLMAGTDPSCPWQLDGMSTAEALEHVLGPLADRLPQFIAMLRARIRWVIPARRDGAWVLVYVTDRVLRDGRPYFQLVVGGAPDQDPQLAPRAYYTEWQVPTSLRALCLVHDGICANTNGVLAARRMADLGEIMAGIEEDLPETGHACRDLLEFHPDGAANCQAFYRRHLDDLDPITVFWNHETNELTRETPFFEYVDQMLARELRDEERSWPRQA